MKRRPHFAALIRLLSVVFAAQAQVTAAAVPGSDSPYLADREWISVSVPFSLDADRGVDGFVNRFYHAFAQLPDAAPGGAGAGTLSGMVESQGFLAPPAPQLLAPEDGSVNLSSPVTLSWSEADGAAGYDVEVAASVDFINTVLATSTTGTQQNFTPGVSGTYYWRARGTDGEEAGEWSDPFSFSVLLSPGLPALVQPLDGSTDLLPNLTLEWLAGVDAASHDIQVHTSETFPVDPTYSDVSGESYEAAPLNTGTYFWRVRARNINGVSDWTAAWSFDVLAAPPAPVLLSPPDGTANLPSQVTLTWQEVDVSDVYRLQLSTSANFATTVLDQSEIDVPEWEVSGLQTGTYYWRVRGANSNGSGPWSSAFSFSVLLPPGLPVLVQPVDGATDLAPTLTLEWLAGQDAASHDIQVQTSETFPEDPTYSEVPGTSLEIGPLNAGTYFWRARARNANGVSDWTAAWSFEVLAPPGAPILVSPADNATGLPSDVTLVWQAAADAQSYRLQLSSSADFAVTLVDQPGIAVTEWEVSGLLTGTYYWRVRSSNAGGVSDWSAAWSFSVLAPPGLPTLVQPSDGATDLPPDVTIGWLAGQDAASHDVQVSTSELFPVDPTYSAVPGTSLEIGPLGTGTYFWRVRARNANGVSNWTEAWSFEVLAAPGAPVLVSPANNAQDLLPDVLLVWQPSAEAESYQLQVSVLADFSTTLVDQSGLTATERQLTALQTGTYYWRMRSSNVGGFSDWSATWSFSVLAPPGLPTLVQPADGAVDLPSSLTLQWQAGKDATSYDIQYGSSPAFPAEPSREDLKATSFQIGPLTTGEYFWRVRSRNKNGIGAWTGTWGFSVLAVPGAPLLLSPENNATDLPPQVTLTWQEAADALAYRLQVSTSADFATTLLDQLNIQATEWGMTNLATGRYFWRVRGSNLNGAGAWSAIRTFSVLAAPGQVQLVAPADAAPDLSDPVQFAWRSVPDAERYHLQIATSGNFITSYYDNSALTDTIQVVQFTSGTYYWHVRAINVNGASPWSQVFRFSVVARPGSPVLVYPEDGAWNLPSAFSLQWSALPFASSYDVQMGVDDTFEVLLVSQEGLTALQTRVGPLDPGDYFWRVRARNSNGIGDWSTPFGFSIVSAPQAPVLIGPADDEVGTVSEPLLEWEPSVNAATYQLQVSRNSTFTSIAFVALDLSGTNIKVGPLDIATTYYWRVQARNAIGASPWSPVFRFTVRQTTALERDGVETPDRFELKPSYPNPFNPTTTIAFSLPHRAPVLLTVHDLHGRLVATLASQDMDAGIYRTSWDAAGESSGVYVLRLKAGSFASSQKLVLLK